MSFETAQIIDSQNSEPILNLSLHDIRLPFPPPFITVSDFINKRESSSRIFRKSPNAFFIYRKAFTNYLTCLNYKLTMIDVSRLVSNRWKNESDQVKEEYVKIAKEIDVELKEKRKHDKKCPVVWKTDKKSKKPKRKSRKNFLNNNNSTNNNHNNHNNINTLTKINTSDIAFEFHNFSIPAHEDNQKTLRSLEEVDSQSSLENSPNSISYPLINFPVFQGCEFINYGNSCESPSNESEEENFECQPVYSLSPCEQNLNPVYCSRYNAIEGQINSQGSEYNNIVNYDLNINNLFVPYSWDMNDPCINGGNLTCQQEVEFH